MQEATSCGLEYDIQVASSCSLRAYRFWLPAPKHRVKSNLISRVAVVALVGTGRTCQEHQDESRVVEDIPWIF